MKTNNLPLLEILLLRAAYVVMSNVCLENKAVKKHALKCKIRYREQLINILSYKNS